MTFMLSVNAPRALKVRRRISLFDFTHSSSLGSVVNPLPKTSQFMLFLARFCPEAGAFLVGDSQPVFLRLKDVPLSSSARIARNAESSELLSKVDLLVNGAGAAGASSKDMR